VGRTNLESVSKLPGGQWTLGIEELVKTMTRAALKSGSRQGEEAQAGAGLRRAHAIAAIFRVLERFAFPPARSGCVSRVLFAIFPETIGLRTKKSCHVASSHKLP
jgi:hypothetical protein